jgi:hypothetical protein
MVVSGQPAPSAGAVRPVRQGDVVFMTQFMPPNSYPVRDQISAAIEADLSPESSSRASA